MNIYETKLAIIGRGIWPSKIKSSLESNFQELHIETFSARDVVSNSKLENAGWVPTFTLEDGIKELIKGYQLIRKFKDKDFTNL